MGRGRVELSPEKTGWDINSSGLIFKVGISSKRETGLLKRFLSTSSWHTSCLHSYFCLIYQESPNATGEIKPITLTAGKARQIIVE